MFWLSLSKKFNYDLRFTIYDLRFTICKLRIAKFFSNSFFIFLKKIIFEKNIFKNKFEQFFNSFKIPKKGKILFLKSKFPADFRRLNTQMHADSAKICVFHLRKSAGNRYTNPSFKIAQAKFSTNRFFSKKFFNSHFSVKKRVTLLFIMLLGLSSCQKKSNLSDTEKKELPSDFVAFYTKFHSDSLYQIAHIQFPLSGFPSQVDSIADNFSWTKENWRMHRAENFKDSLFTRTFETPLPNCVNESVVIKNTSVGTFRRFYKRDNEWYLIFYSDMNKIQ